MVPSRLVAEYANDVEGILVVEFRFDISNEVRGTVELGSEMSMAAQDDSGISSIVADEDTMSLFFGLSLHQSSLAIWSSD